MKRTLRTCVALALAAVPLLSLAAPASARAMSAGCTAANDPRLDGDYGDFGGTDGWLFAGGGVYGVAEYFEGETITVTATEPMQYGPPSTVNLVISPADTPVGDVYSTPFPGSVSYTFPEDTNFTFVHWYVEGANVDWTVSCRPAMPVSFEDCADGGWQAYGFKNQGECVSYVASQGLHKAR